MNGGIVHSGRVCRGDTIGFGERIKGGKMGLCLDCYSLRVVEGRIKIYYEGYCVFGRYEVAVGDPIN